MSLNTHPVVSKLNLSLAVIWLFHVCGAIGIIYGDAGWFTEATPLNLILCFMLLLFNLKINTKTLITLLICYTVGLSAEIIGVNFGFLFGQYQYGSTLGIKWMGVPLIIGINWCVLVFICATIASTFSNILFQKACIGTFLMLFLDLLIEPVAPALDFWKFKEGIAGAHNYLGWAVVAFPLQIVFAKWNIKLDSQYSFHLYLLQSIFFILMMIRIYTLQETPFIN